MRRYIKNVALFSMIVLAMFVAIEILLLGQPNKYSYKRQYVESHLHDIKTLFLGNSHIEYSVSPKEFGSGAFNLAIEGRPLEYDVALAERYVGKLDSLQVLVLPLDYSDFVLGRLADVQPENAAKRDFNSTYKCMYYKYMGLRLDPFWYWSEILNSKLNYMYRFVGGKWNAVRCDSLGYHNLMLVNRKPGWKERMRPEAVDSNLPVDSAQLKQFENMMDKMARLTLDKNVKMVLLTTPFHDSCLELMNKQLIAEMHSFAKKMEARFPNVRYLDFLTCPQLNDDDFWDSTHLTETGATKFSRLLKSEIEKSYSADGNRVR